jgi:hypothetical protein
MDSHSRHEEDGQPGPIVAEVVVLPSEVEGQEEAVGEVDGEIGGSEDCEKEGGHGGGYNDLVAIEGRQGSQMEGSEVGHFQFVLDILHLFHEAG